MKQGKKSVVLYHDIRGPLLNALSFEEIGRLFLAILDYSEFGIIPDFSGALNMAFLFIKNAIDRDEEAWEAKREKRREAGSLGGKQRAVNQANATFAKQIKQDDANQAVPVPVPVPTPVPVPAPVPAPVPVPANEKKMVEKPPDTIPTFQDVKMYCEEHRYTTNPQRFLDFYSTKDWHIGNTPMKDWKAVLDGWERRANSRGECKGSNSNYAQQHTERHFTIAYDNEG